MKQLAIRADILAKLLLIQETLDVLPDSEGIAAFLRRALDGIPGVTDVHLCVHGVVIPPSDEFKDVCAESEAAWNDSCAYDTCALNKAGTFSVPLRSMHRLHGLLILSLGDEEAFAPYKDFMRNVANVIAMALDHRDYIREINEAKFDLETRVVERTAKLKESEEKFRAIVETTSDWVWEVDASGVYTYVSPKVKTFLGYEPEEVIGKTPFDFMLPEEGRRVGRIFQAAVAARQPLEQFLHTNQHKDGHSIVLETSGVPIFDVSGNVAGYRCIDRDVTRRKRAQEEILHLATFPQFTPWLVLEVGRKAEVLYINPALQSAMERWGIGDPIQLIPPPWQQKLSQSDAIGQEVVHQEVHLAGRIFEEWILFLPQFQTLRIYAGDITERKRAEEALRESEARLDLALRSAEMGAWHWDIVENKRYFDAQVCRLLGIDSATFTGTAEEFYRLVHPGDRETLKAALARTVEQDVLYQPEYRALWPDGSVRYIAARGRLIHDEKGRPLRVNGIIWDITERKRAEQQLALVNFAMNHVREAAFLTDENARLHYVNDNACQVLGYSREELLGLSVADLDPDFPLERWPDHWRELKARQSLTFEGRHRRKDGGIFPAEIAANYFEYEGRGYNLGLVRDITARKQGELALERANRALRALSACNQALVRAANESELLDSVCQLILENGGYRMVWVGFAEQDPAKTVRPAAHYGHEEGFLAEAKFSWADTELGRGPTGTAIRTGTAQVNRNFLTDPALAPWREAALKRGYQSSIALPLKSSAGTLGALTIYAPEPDAFNENEVRLLQELADDLAFGIVTQRAHAAQRESEARLDLALRSAEMGAWHWDIVENKRYFDPQACRLAGIDSATFTGAAEEFFRIVHPGDLEMLKATLARTIDQNVLYEPEYRVVWPDGSVHCLTARGRLVHDDNGRPLRIDGIIWDSTERKQAEEYLRRSEEQFRLLLNSTAEAIYGVDVSGKCTFCNQAFLRCMGYSDSRSLLGQRIHALIHHTRPDGTPYPEEDCQIFQAFREGIPSHADNQVLWRADGTSFPVESWSTPILRDKQIIGCVVAFVDITERKQAELALERANRALRTLSACNEALVHAANESELLDSVCRLIVETGGYRMAWVGFPEQDPAKTVRMVAHYGYEDEYLSTTQISWADTALGRGPTGTAIRTGTVQINRNFLTDPALAPWREAALKCGYRSSIALPLQSSAGILGALTIYAPEPSAFDDAAVKLLQELAADIAFGIESLRTRAERDRNAYEHIHHAEMVMQGLEDSIKAISNTVEMRDPYTAGHQRRVGKLAVAIAREMELPEETIHGIELAARIHDLGKITVPAEILAKPGLLSDIEMMLIRNHVKAGHDILKDIKFPWPIATIVWQHHENLDGSGYPQGLKGEQIILDARILSVADVVEAMSSHRPYRPARSVEDGLEEISKKRGTCYDPAVVDACLKLFREKGFKLGV